MDKDRFAQLQELFQRAAGLTGDARQEILRQARERDDTLADELEALLAREDRARASIDVRLDLVGARHPEHAEALRQLRSNLVGFGARTGGPELSEILDQELQGWEERGGSIDELASTEILARIHGRKAPHERYLVEDEVGRGGMGTVLRVWDQDLRRPLAMKVRLPGLGDRSASGGLGRFLEEAQVTGRLDHPGIVPVHELGTDANRQTYFTMKLVQGDDLEKVFDKVADGRDGWTLARAVRTLLRVCEAMAYAHAKGVLHRDLKPANVMIGRFGEVYVMDWGLARVMEQADTRDIRPRREGEERLDSEVRSLAVAKADSPLLTMEGTVIGTPTYMSPEQACGKTDLMGPPSDVYAIGAMLYRLLAGAPPYVSRFMPRRAPQAILLDLLKGPPVPLEDSAPDAPPELVSICEKAMSREPDERYADPGEIGHDIEAWLEGRVVRAYERGAWAEARKWVRRNRGLAAALGAALVLALAGLGGISYVQAEGRKTAEAERSVAVRERNNVLRLSAFARLDDLERRAVDLWPAVPEQLSRLDAWIAEARQLVAGLDPDPETDDVGHLAQLRELERRGERAADAPGGWRFSNEESAWWHAELSDLVARIRAFADEETGLMSAGRSPEHGAWGVQRRRDWAAGLDELTVRGSEATRRWQRARISIADVDRSPLYGGLEIGVLRGLLPLGQDPDSGLWEFFHPATGMEPVRDVAGRLVLNEETGLVFVLLPEGSFVMGCQGSDPDAPNHDPTADEDEGPVHPVTLSPFLIAKHELTQGQWLRLTGRNPSLYSPDRGYRNLTLQNPVENVTWEECRELLARYELDLPTEAQWEYAARAGTSSVFSTGDERDSLVGHVNLADQAAARRGITWFSIQDWPELDDGWALHAPVGSFRPNAFGLHDVHGNVQEWCRDGRGSYDEEPEQEPYRSPDNLYRIYRGGGFQGPAADARSAKRSANQRSDARVDVGVRPGRALR